MRPHLLAVRSPSGRLRSRCLAPFLGLGLALLAPIWHLPARTLFWGCGRSSASCMFPIRPALLLLHPPGWPCLLIPAFPGRHPRSHLRPVSGDLEAFLNSRAGPGPGTRLAQSLRVPSLKLDHSHAEEEERAFMFFTDILLATHVRTDTFAVLSFRPLHP